MNPREVALAFVEAINSKQLDTLRELMTEHHAFIDSDGTELKGRREMLEGWRRYFAMVPDYRIDVREFFTRDRTVVLLGVAEGTFANGETLIPKNHWSVPAAWRVVVEGDRVAVWQLYVNPEPMRRIIDKMDDR